jgi:hypothetical protein
MYDANMQQVRLAQAKTNSLNPPKKSGESR